MRTTCRQPDHDCPRLVCGYPVPCPWHTAIIDPYAQPVPTITIPVTADAALAMPARARLARIGIALAPKPKQKLKKGGAGR